jgi:hypothetical protein
MWNAMRVAVRILCVCAIVGFVEGPAGGQEQPAPSAQTGGQTPPPSQTPAPVVEQVSSGDTLSVTLLYWINTGTPQMKGGEANTNTSPSNLPLERKNKPSPGAEVTIPAGKHSSIRASFFRVQGAGNTTATQALNVFGTDYNAGDYLATSFTLYHMKLSYDYLSWPFPVKRSKFRFKTLWGVQFTTIKAAVDAPYLHGETDASGNLITTSGTGSHWFIYPDLGVGADYLVSQNFRFEARASGFGWPHRSDAWEVDASANYRFGKFELQAGAKTFHFKTSPKKTEYIAGTLPGAYVGLRYYLGHQNK